MRHFRFWVGHVLRFRTRLVLGPWMSWVAARLGTRGSFEGIEIVGLPVGKGEAAPTFLPHTAAALRLIQSVDPRRFRRVRREIRSIRDVPGLSFASYNRPSRVCCVDHTRFAPEVWEQHPEWYQWCYAASLVHEATHGAIYSRHIQYTAALRARIERLCCEEARRFARHADRDDRQWSDVLVPPFDEKRWHESWHRTWWQGTKGHFARLREVVADERTKGR